MAKLLYTHPADNILANATLTLPTGVAATGYPLTNIRDGDPANPFKCTGTSIRIVMDFGAPVSLGLVSLVHHNFDQALNVRWQGHTADAWGAPDIDLAVTIPATDEDGFIDNPYLDCTGQAAKRYWSVANLAANSVNVILGELYVSALTRTPVYNYHWGAKERERRRGEQHLTAYDVRFRYDRGVRRRELIGETMQTDAGFAQLRAWVRACRGSTRSMLLVPDPAINSAWLAHWTEESAEAFERTQTFINHNPIPLGWLELSRGLPWLTGS